MEQMKYIFTTILLLLISCRTYDGIDTTKPSAYINSPKNGVLVSDTLIVSAIGSDDVGIEYIELWLNQEKTTKKDYEPPFEFILDTHSLLNTDEGETIELSVKAYDTSENESALSSSVNVYLDNSNPTKVILSPIIEENGVLQFNWDKSNDLDFYAYVITVNNSPFNLIDTIFSINYTQTQIQYNYQDTEFFGIRVIDKGLKSTQSNLVQPVTFEFITIQSGTFYFGENDESKFVTEPYQIMTSEVTNIQYRSYLSVARELNEIDTSNIYPWVIDNEGNVLYDLENGYISWNGTNFEIDGTQNPLLPHYPVTNVSYHGARHFANFFGFDLPLEINWEKAATVNGLFDYPWGSEFDDENNPINEIRSSYANYFENEDFNGLAEPYEPGGENNDFNSPGLAPVKYLEGEIDEFWFFSKCPSECQGLNHMSGNVWEWVRNENPDNFINNQIAKGGSWRSPKQELRVWSRKYLDPSATGDHVGFRCSK
tara:strand:- start:2604 stop:4055 length:1452 start_codon:yes stop_codon:yes gene_type:complete